MNHRFREKLPKAEWMRAERRAVRRLQKVWVWMTLSSFWTFTLQKKSSEKKQSATLFLAGFTGQPCIAEWSADPWSWLVWIFLSSPSLLGYLPELLSNKLHLNLDIKSFCPSHVHTEPTHLMIIWSHCLNLNFGWWTMNIFKTTELKLDFPLSHWTSKMKWKKYLIF